MSWRDVLTATPHPPSQYSHNPQNTLSDGICENIGNIGNRVSENNTTSTRIAELREKAKRADDLRGVIDETQAAFDAGEATGEEVESLSGYAWDRSRQIPEDGEVLSELLSRQPVVRVRSRLLGEVVVWVADTAEIPETTQVIYREAELRALNGASPEMLRAVHETKRAIDGQLV